MSLSVLYTVINQSETEKSVQKIVKKQLNENAQKAIESVENNRNQISKHSEFSKHTNNKLLKVKTS